MKAVLEKWEQWIPANDPGYNILVSSPMIAGLINKLLPMGERFIEWGYGTGYTAIALANQKKCVVGYDPAEGLRQRAEAAKEKHFISHGGGVNFYSKVSDLPGGAEVVYSQGLLEHFDDETLYQVIASQLLKADKAVVFSVPSENYPRIDFGDERLMDLSGWERALAPFVYNLKQLYYYEQRQHIMGVIRK